jgi:hypothetical protein
MAFIPDRERSAPRERERESSDFALGLVLYAACCAVSLWLLWPQVGPQIMQMIGGAQ